MIRHIVIFKLESSYSDTEKTGIKTQLKDMLLDLQDKIDEIKSMSVWFSTKQAGAASSDIMLDTTFDSLETLEHYRVHPAHVKVLEYVKSLKLQRASIDFDC